MYDLSFTNGTGDLVSLNAGVNTETGYMFVTVFLIVFYIIIFAANKRFDSKAVFFADNLICTLISVMLFFANPPMISVITLWCFVVLLAISTFLLIFDSKE